MVNIKAQLQFHFVLFPQQYQYIKEKQIMNNAINTSEVNVYLRNCQKKACLVQMRRETNQTQVSKVASNKFKIDLADLVLYYKGKKIQKQQNIQLHEKNIIHVINLQNVNRQNLHIKVKHLQGEKVITNYDVSNKTIIREFVDTSLSNNIGKNMNQMFLVYVGKQLDVDRSFLDELVEDQSQMLCIDAQYSESSVLTPVRKEYSNIQEKEPKLLMPGKFHIDNIDPKKIGNNMTVPNSTGNIQEGQEEVAPLNIKIKPKNVKEVNPQDYKKSNPGGLQGGHQHQHQDEDPPAEFHSGRESGNYVVIAQDVEKIGRGNERGYSPGYVPTQNQAGQVVENNGLENNAIGQEISGENVIIERTEPNYVMPKSGIPDVVNLKSQETLETPIKIPQIENKQKQIKELDEELRAGKDKVEEKGEQIKRKQQQTGRQVDKVIMVKTNQDPYQVKQQIQKAIEKAKEQGVDVTQTIKEEVKGAKQVVNIEEPAKVDEIVQQVTIVERDEPTYISKAITDVVNPNEKEQNLVQNITQTPVINQQGQVIGVTQQTSPVNLNEKEEIIIEKKQEIIEKQEQVAEELRAGKERYQNEVNKVEENVADVTQNIKEVVNIEEPAKVDEIVQQVTIVERDEPTYISKAITDVVNPNEKEQNLVQNITQTPVINQQGQVIGVTQQTSPVNLNEKEEIIIEKKQEIIEKQEQVAEELRAGKERYQNEVNKVEENVADVTQNIKEVVNIEEPAKVDEIVQQVTIVERDEPTYISKAITDVVNPNEKEQNLVQNITQTPVINQQGQVIGVTQQTSPVNLNEKEEIIIEKKQEIIEKQEQVAEELRAGKERYQNEVNKVEENVADVTQNIKEVVNIEEPAKVDEIVQQVTIVERDEPTYISKAITDVVNPNEKEQNLVQNITQTPVINQQGQVIGVTQQTSPVNLNEKEEIIIEKKQEIIEKQEQVAEELRAGKERYQNEVNKVEENVADVTQNIKEVVNIEEPAKVDEIVQQVTIVERDEPTYISKAITDVVNPNEKEQNLVQNITQTPVINQQGQVIGVTQQTSPVNLNEKEEIIIEKKQEIIEKQEQVAEELRAGKERYQNEVNKVEENVADVTQNIKEVVNIEEPAKVDEIVQQVTIVERDEPTYISKAITDVVNPNEKEQNLVQNITQTPVINQQGQVIGVTQQTSPVNLNEKEEIIIEKKQEIIEKQEQVAEELRAGKERYQNEVNKVEENVADVTQNIKEVVNIEEPAKVDEIVQQVTIVERDEPTYISKAITDVVKPNVNNIISQTPIRNSDGQVIDVIQQSNNIQTFTQTPVYNQQGQIIGVKQQNYYKHSLMPQQQYVEAIHYEQCQEYYQSDPQTVGPYVVPQPDIVTYPTQQHQVYEQKYDIKEADKDLQHYASKGSFQYGNDKVVVVQKSSYDESKPEYNNNTQIVPLESAKNDGKYVSQQMQGQHVDNINVKQQYESKQAQNYVEEKRRQEEALILLQKEQQKEEEQLLFKQEQEKRQHQQELILLRQEEEKRKKEYQSILIKQREQKRLAQEVEKQLHAANQHQVNKTEDVITNLIGTEMAQRIDGEQADKSNYSFDNIEVQYQAQKIEFKAGDLIYSGEMHVSETENMMGQILRDYQYLLCKDGEEFQREYGQLFKNAEVA